MWFVKTPLSSEIASRLAQVSTLQKFDALLALRSDADLGLLARESAAITRAASAEPCGCLHRFISQTNALILFPIADFSGRTPSLRVTLEIEGVAVEASHIVGQDSITYSLSRASIPSLSGDYLRRCIRRLSPMVPSVSLEVAPMEWQTIRLWLTRCGRVGYTQSPTTGPPLQMHLAGPDFDWRLVAPAGLPGRIRRIGVGALFGLWH
jgi:hypothetical protein